MIFDEIDGRVGLANGSDDLILVGVANVFLGKQKDGKQRRIRKRKDTSCQPPSNSKMFDRALWVSARSDEAKELRQLDGRASQQRYPIFARQSCFLANFCAVSETRCSSAGSVSTHGISVAVSGICDGVTALWRRPKADLWSCSSFDFAGVVDQCV